MKEQNKMNNSYFLINYPNKNKLLICDIKIQQSSTIHVHVEPTRFIECKS